MKKDKGRKLSPQLGKQFGFSARINKSTRRTKWKLQKQTHPSTDAWFITTKLTSQGSSERADFSINGAGLPWPVYSMVRASACTL